MSGKTTTFAGRMISTDFHSDLVKILKPYEGRGVYWLTDENVDATYHDFANSNGLVLPAGEQYKTLDSVIRIWNFLEEKGATRQSLLVCVGGGVITDLGGFAAATFKRGMAYLNIPTTLLAAVDAAIGGKTGFNFNGLKNEIGVFNPPIETLIYTPFFKTLPYKELLSGYGEMLKTALLSSSDLLSQVIDVELFTPDWVALNTIIERCIRVKESIIARDQNETNGERKALNLGHTIGHALESFSYTSNEPLAHGVAVAYGLLAELYISLLRHDFPSDVLSLVSACVRAKYGKYSLSCGTYEELYKLMLHDKKNTHHGQVVCTLLKNVGQYEVNQTVSKDIIFQALDFLFNL